MSFVASSKERRSLEGGGKQDLGVEAVGISIGFAAGGIGSAQDYKQLKHMTIKEGRYLPIGWTMLPAIVATMAVAGIGGLVASIVTGGPWWFFILFLAMVAWFAINGLYRTGYELRFDDTYLYWRGFLRSGSVLIADIAGFDSEFLGEIAVFICRDGERIRIVVLQGFAPFLKAFTEAHPKVNASPGWYARFVERAQWKP